MEGSNWALPVVEAAAVRREKAGEQKRQSLTLLVTGLRLLT